ncbi:phosphoribosylanthranilate isomerase [Candidatus Methylocalor cossyra]
MKRRTRVKICGLTRPDDAVAAVRLGADAIGLVFYPPSPRQVSVAAARAIVNALPPFATVVGLFVDEEAGRLREILDQVRIDLLQFHGDEDPGYCAAFGKPYIKALRVRPGLDLTAAAAAYRNAAGILLDAWDPGARGGTGQRFDWRTIPAELAGASILAGGLDPDNVSEALRTVRPYALDVSSGVESAKGIKDIGKMAAFLEAVQRFDYHDHAD